MIEDKIFEFSAKKNSIDLLYNDDRFCIVGIDLMHEDETEEDCNRNMCNISHEAMVNSLSSIFNTTISCKYNSVCKDFIDDVSGHYSNEKELFETHIVGHIPSDARTKFIKRDNGKVYLNVEAIIHKNLEPQIVDILNKNSGELKISTVIKCIGEQNDKTGIFKIDKFVLQTTTILSPKVMEGIEGSHVEVKKFSKKQLTKANEVYLQFAYDGKKEDIFEEIKNEQKKENEVVNNLGTRELEHKLWLQLKDYKYSNGDWEGCKYWIENILPDTKEVIVYDNQTDELYKIPYVVSEEGEVSAKEELRVKVEVEINYREINNCIEFSFAKEDYGTGNEIKIDKSKDAVSEKEWGKVNKISLRNKVLNAKNYKELAKELYLIAEEGWEDAPSKKLKYPVMEIKAGVAVYNRYALASALTYAKANNEEAIVSKIEKLYGELEIDDGNNEKDVSNVEDQKTEEPIESEKPKDDIVQASLDVENFKNEIKELQSKFNESEQKYKDLEKLYSELENKCGDMENKLAEYKAREDKEAMFAYLKSFKKSFSQEEYDKTVKEIENKSRSEFESFVDEKVKDFVRKMSDTADSEDEENLNSVVKNCYGLMQNYNNGKKSKTSSIDDVLAKLK